MLTIAEIEAIRKRAEKATEGPWEWVACDELHETEMPELGNGKESIMSFGDREMYYPTEGTPPNTEDAEFIAHARTDIPKLLAEIDRLNELIDKAEGLLSDAHDLLDDVHCYETEVYELISKFLYGDDDE